LRVVRMFIIVILTYLPYEFGLQIRAFNLYGWFINAIGVALWCGLVTILINYLLDHSVFKDIIVRMKALIGNI
jgi:hypothetical protein